MSKIPFNRPHLTGRELDFIRQAHEMGRLSGDGPYTKKCHEWFEGTLNIPRALLTHSCTAALEMMALLADLEPGDEVILPSYTFVSTANAFVLRGARPVFVDIDPTTLNLDAAQLEKALSPKTKVIAPVHYAGVACDMDPILEFAKAHKLFVFEDAAQGFAAYYKGRPLGTLGELGAFSFHETKNVISGEGGALLINRPEFVQRAEIIREKGTNRSQFFRGQVDKYTWVDIGSSFLPGEIVAAFLYAQLENGQSITEKRLELWKRYHESFAPLETTEKLRRPLIPGYAQHNAHMYYVLTRSLEERTRIIEELSRHGIHSVFHYVPLHSSPAGLKYGRAVGSLEHTNSIADRLLRLPLYHDLSFAEQDAILTRVHDIFDRL